MKTLKFKTVEPFFGMMQRGEKTFDIRKYDPKDTRFRALSQVMSKENVGWLIEFTNPADGEQWYMRLISVDYIKDTEGYLVQPNWIIMFLREP